jgi:hypothetical protein
MTHHTEALSTSATAAQGEERAELIERLLHYADVLDSTERPAIGEYDVTADIRRLTRELEGERRMREQVVGICDHSATATHPDAALRFIREIAASAALSTAEREA